MGKSGFRRPRFPSLLLATSFRRFPLSKKSLLVASACVAYLLFALVGYTQQQQNRRTPADQHRRGAGFYDSDSEQSLARPRPSNAQLGALFTAPSRSNVVYITLRAKPLKPANIRGTVRPKLRPKSRRFKSTTSAFARSKLATLAPDARRRKRFDAPRSARDAGSEDAAGYTLFKVLPDRHADRRAGSHISSIRMYSQRAPPWLSARDVEALRFLAEANVWRVREVSRGDSAPLLLFENERAAGRRLCAGACGVIGSPAENTEVFAFHLDRVLGLNRTPPAVSRKFRFLHGGQSCPVVLWDASLYPEGPDAGGSAMRMTWGEYQSSLKRRCWHRSSSPKLSSGCSTVHHYEWSKLALFDFLLQIHSRLDQGCCGFRPRQEDVCDQRRCADQNNIELNNIQRGSNPRRLVFRHNRGFFDRNEDNLDFRILEGIKELPEQAVSVLSSMRLRERLLQSLFMDQTYWESQGGRQGIDKLIDVIEKRVKVLLTYINAYGIQAVAMDV